MKKAFLKTISMALACILLLSVFACSGGEQKTETPAPDGQDALATPSAVEDLTANPTEAPTPEITPEPTPTPGSTEKPTPGPTAMPLDGPSTEEEKQYAEAAFQFVEQIGRIHNKHFSPENTAVSEFYWQPEWLSVVFQAEEPGQSIRMLGKPDGNGGYTFSMKDMTMVMLINEFREQEWLDSYSEDIWAAYHESLGEARFVITPEDIANAGCTATEGEEYLLAVGRCWQKKYAEFFMNLPENYPGYCYEMLPLDCTVDHYYADQNKVQFVAGFASRPADLRAIAYLYFEIDEGGGFADESYPPEIYGWLVTYGGTMLEQQEDGSWVGTTSCHTFG